MSGQKARRATHPAGTKHSGRVTHIELLFDLIFVLALTPLSNYRYDNLTVTGVREFTVLALAYAVTMSRNSSDHGERAGVRTAERLEKPGRPMKLAYLRVHAINVAGTLAGIFTDIAMFAVTTAILVPVAMWETTMRVRSGGVTPPRSGQRDRR